ncbi:hypothetical protein TNCV_2962971 [Trichonephila clavipes]|nr:hypothetical protein TNCV_2962971 [Trichonephila clavipes]
MTQHHQDSSQSRRITTASLECTPESSRQRSSTLIPNTKWYLTPRRSLCMDLYSSEKSRSLRKLLRRKLREVVHVPRMKSYHDPAEQIETEDIPPKESYKGPITVPE